MQSPTKAQLQKAEREGVLRWKEELDAGHVAASSTDGCVCDLCKAARKAHERLRSDRDALLAALARIRWKADSALREDGGRWAKQALDAVDEIAERAIAAASRP